MFRIRHSFGREEDHGDLDRGCRAIDISGKDERLCSLTCPLMIALFLVAIPKYTNGKLTLVPKNRAGQPLKNKVEALENPAVTRPICCRQRARWIRVVSLPERGMTRVGRSRNDRRSWITSAICR